MYIAANSTKMAEMNRGHLELQFMRMNDTTIEMMGNKLQIFVSGGFSLNPHERIMCCVWVVNNDFPLGCFFAYAMLLNKMQNSSMVKVRLASQFLTICKIQFTAVKYKSVYISFDFI